MHREALKKTKSYFGITGKQLHLQTGVSENHISEFLRGKRTVSSDILDRLVQAMEDLEPGSKQFYADEIRGKKLEQTLANIDPATMVNGMSNEQLSKLMFAIAARLGNQKNSKQTNKNDQLTAIA